MNKEILTKLANDRLSIREISKELNLSYTAIRYWLKKFDLRTSGYNRIFNWGKEDLIKAVSNSKCKSDVLRNLGLKVRSGNFQTLDRYIKKYNIDASGLVYTFKRGNFKFKYSHDEVFRENNYTHGKDLKRRILKNNLIEYKCAECNNEGKWNGKELKLQVDHINGINDDNRIENLRFICPNCHSQTETFCRGASKLNRRKNKDEKHKKTEEEKLEMSLKRRIKIRPTKEILLKEVEEIGYCATGRKYGVSDNSIRNWLK